MRSAICLGSVSEHKDCKDAPSLLPCVECLLWESMQVLASTMVVVLIAVHWLGMWQHALRMGAQVRGDKIIVFSDNIFALREYAQRLRKPFIYGGTSHQERTRVLAAFKRSAEVRVARLTEQNASFLQDVIVFVSKIFGGCDAGC